MAFFDHHGDRYYYFDAGSGAPVLLLHGLSNTGRAWTPQVPEMMRLGHRIIVPDLLGHGASGPVGRTFTPYEQGQAALALLEFLGLESAVFVGLSLGGMVALEVATMSPEAVEKLIVAGTFRTMATPNRQEMLNVWIEAHRHSGGCLKRFKSSWTDLVGKDFANSPLGVAWYQTWHAQAAIQDPANQINWCEGMKSYDAGQNLGRITAPTLVLAGAQDPISPISESQAIADQIRSATVDIVPGGGHVFNMSCAYEFNRRTIDFLRGN